MQTRAFGAEGGRGFAAEANLTKGGADYIVGLYNSTRLHFKLGNLSPNAFERESAAQHPIDVSEITGPPQPQHGHQYDGGQHSLRHIAHTGVTSSNASSTTSTDTTVAQPVRAPA